jgi:hypothetical protein
MGVTLAQPESSAATATPQIKRDVIAINNLSRLIGG